MMIVFYILGIIFLFNAVFILGLTVRGIVIRGKEGIPPIKIIICMIVLFICGLGLLWMQ